MTPAVFTDELLYAKLAQSLAAGEGFVLRGEAVLFPAPLPILLQAPAWLLGDAQTAYAAARGLNAALMAAAVFPAYLLARQLVGRVPALVTAAAAAAAPAFLYHAYLMSEAAAYPAFLTAVAVMVRALARPSRAWDAAVVAAAMLAVLARTQFVVVPLAYLVAVGISGRVTGEGARAAYRRHALSTGLLTALGAGALLTGGAVLGPYLGAVFLEYSPLEIGRWAVRTLALLPFGCGWLVVPGALAGLACLLVRPRSRAEAGFGALLALLVPAVVLEAALVAGAESQRVMERYTVYLVPLAFTAFFAYAAHGAPRRRLYAAGALALGTVALVAPLATLADHRFSFDSPTLSAYGAVAARLSEGDAAALFAATGLLGSLLAAATRPRGRAAVALGAGGAALLLAVGAGAYDADHAMSKRSRATWSASPPDWIDQARVGRADYLALPGVSPHFAWAAETWNRDFGLPLRLGDAAGDGYRSPVARIRSDGRLLVDGSGRPSRHLVVNAYATAIELDGEPLARPRPYLTLYRLPAVARVRSLATGLYFDGWGSAVLRYQVWPQRPAARGRYRVRLALPARLHRRRVEAFVDGGARRSVELRGGEAVTLEVPVRGAPVPVLHVRTDRGDYRGGATPNPRMVAVRVLDLAYLPSSS